MKGIVSSDQFRAQLLVHLLENHPFQGAKGDRVRHFHEVACPNIGGGHDVKPGQVEGFPGSERDSAGIQDLQEEVEHQRVRFLDFIEEDHPGSAMFDSFAQDAFSVAMLSQQQAD